MSEYDYFLYTLINKQNIDPKVLINTIKISINQNVKPASSIKNVIYPTHDNQVYVVYEKSKRVQFPETIKTDDIALIQEIKGINVFENLYMEINKTQKSKLIDENNENIESSYAIIKNNSFKQSTNEIYTCDYYQLELIHYLLSDKKKPSGRTPSYSSIVTSSNIASNFEKDKYEYNIDIMIESNDYLKYMIQDGSDLIIEIVKGDITDQRTDAITNAANTHLGLGGGVAGALRDKAGSKLQDECDSFTRKNGQLKVGQVIHTGSGKMKNCKHILHAVGPNMSDFKNRASECYELLKTTFLNTLMYCEKLDSVTSVSLPLISSGIYEVPTFVCCQQLYNGLNEYVEKTHKNRKLKLIKIVSIDPKIHKEILDFFINALEKSKKPVPIKETPSLARLVSEHGKCSLCTEVLSIVKSLECGCKYCKSCFPNYEQNKTCECKEH